MSEAVKEREREPTFFQRGPAVQTVTRADRRSLGERVDRAIVLVGSLGLLFGVLGVVLLVLSGFASSQHADRHVAIDPHGTRWPVPLSPSTADTGHGDAR